jgi:hypothetical protein
MLGNRALRDLAKLLIAAALACSSAPALTSAIDDDRSLASQTGALRPSLAASAYGAPVTTRFRSFGGEILQVGFMLDPEAGRSAWREFGVDQRELEALQQSCVDSGRCSQAEMNQLTFDYYRRHGLRTREVPGEGLRLFVDVPQMARRNRERVLPVANALQQLAAARGGDEGWLIDAAVALVQTGLDYRQPALWDDGRKVAGFYPPARALEKGYGDCDTKAALLAAILMNVGAPRMIGVHVPQHYLLGIAGTPQPEQAYLRHDGETYVLVETAGPGLRPRGDIADTTQAALARRTGIRIDPIL